MNAALAALLKTLGDRHGRTILAAENADEGTLHDNCFGVLSESFHLIALEGLAAYLERRVYARELAQSATTFLHDPSVPNIVKFQSQLFARYRPLFGQVFPVRFPGKDLIPLYLKKYLQILDEFNQFSLLERDKRNAPEAERILFEAMTFLVNNWTPVVAHLKPSQNVPDGPEVIPLSKDGPRYRRSGPYRTRSRKASTSSRKWGSPSASTLSCTTRTATLSSSGCSRRRARSTAA